MRSSRLDDQSGVSSLRSPSWRPTALGRPHSYYRPEDGTDLTKGPKIGPPDRGVSIASDPHGPRGASAPRPGAARSGRAARSPPGRSAGAARAPAAASGVVGLACIASSVLTASLQLLGPLGEDLGRVVDRLDPHVLGRRLVERAEDERVGVDLLDELVAPVGGVADVGDGPLDVGPVPGEDLRPPGRRSGRPGRGRGRRGPGCRRGRRAAARPWRGPWPTMSLTVAVRSRTLARRGLEVGAVLGEQAVGLVRSAMSSRVRAASIFGRGGVDPPGQVLDVPGGRLDRGPDRLGRVAEARRRSPAASPGSAGPAGRRRRPSGGPRRSCGSGGSARPGPSPTCSRIGSKNDDLDPLDDLARRPAPPPTGPTRRC